MKLSFHANQRLTNILVIDDEKLILWGIQRDLERAGYRISAFQKAEDALQLLEKQQFHAALLDVRLPGMGGIEMLERIKSVSPDTQVIMITAFADVEMAVSSIRRGAFDFILKPFSLEKIHLAIQNALETSRLKREVASLKIDRAMRLQQRFLQGESPRMRSVIESIERIGRAGAGVVLICGESGTGKGLAANAIHQLGPRSTNPFIEINCSAIPENLFESELFGHEMGSFTGAVSQKKGLLELADNGTIFLDEVTEMPITSQTKFLKALEEQVIRRVGGQRSIKVDVNIVAATNRDLSQAVRDGIFREDLFYRLNVVPIFIPPLREREHDILLLSEHYFNVYQAKYKRSFSGFCEEAKQRMLEYSWPGNIRELKNSVERAVILETADFIQEITLGLGPTASPNVYIQPKIIFSDDSPFPESGIDLLGYLESIEKRFLQKALQHCDGNQSHASKLLGMSRDILRYRLKKYNLFVQERDQDLGK
ncbi:sigma-54-dependent Fis family transcriptional regulator [bacterium]|nr:sigma-54-dependent Fis family transcriptional regulator [bacterium]